MPVLNSIDGVPLESPFTLAALSGYSDVGMRVTCRALGASLTRNEVVLDKFVLDRGKGAKNGRHLHPDDRPVAAQLMGAEPGTMGEAAALMEEFGYDLVDINFGCPVKKVLGRCRGGYLLGDPETAIEMLKRVRGAVTTPVTIKMRIGRDETVESEENFWRILDAGVAIGIGGVVIHGRTVAQRYEGFAKWDRIAAAKAKYPDLVVMGSGDLFSADDCLRMLAETGADGVTIARGAIANPWIFGECLALARGEPLPEPPTLAEQGDLMDWQFALATEQYGEERAGRQMRKFGIKRAALHPMKDEVHASFIKLTTNAEWRAVRARYYSSHEPGVRPAPEVAAACEEGCGV